MQNPGDELLTIKNEYIKVISWFNQEQFNLKSDAGSWTGGQVVEHMRLSNGGILELLNGNTKPTQREPNALLDQIKSHLCNHDIKLTSPEFVFPADKTYNQQELLAATKTIFAQITKACNTSDLTKTHIDFPFPVYGELTGLELIYFVIYHTERHTRQLINVYQQTEKLIMRV